MLERIESLSKVAQSIAVILGIIVATHGLVLKDRDHNRQLLELTLKQLDVGLLKPVQDARKRLFALEDFARRTPWAMPNDPASEKQEYEMRLDVGRRFDDETRELAYFYNTITRCYEAGFCVKELVLALLCEDARRDLTAIAELDGRVGNRYFNPHFFEGLGKLQRSCKGQKSIAVPYLQHK